jgi:glucose/arabinose dehydrogenase
MAMRSPWLYFVLAFTALLMDCGSSSSTSGGSSPPPKSQVQITLTPFVSGFSSPLDLENAGDSTNRLFVVEQAGTIRIIQNGAIVPTPFLDITSKVTSGGETGLLGVTFHPSFAQHPLFYVNYTRTVSGQLQTVIAEYQVAAGNPNLADPNSERILLIVNQPFANHNAGQLAFGPDGMLYFGLGDGGSGGDPLGNGQNLQTLLGKMLRIDVDHTAGTKPYAIPADNPFASGGGLQEIWAYGFRNPWRFSFDNATGRLFVADVGQDAFEEIDIVTKGANYGWNIMEGSHCFNPSSGCNMSGLTLPIIDYAHSEGDTVIGGYLYRGSLIPALQGAYIFGDFSNGKVWMLQETTPGSWTRTQLLSTGKPISSFGRDEAGELYAVDYSGSVLQVRPQ